MKPLFNPAPKLEMLDFVSLMMRLGVGGFMLTHGIPKFERYINGDLQFADPFGLGAEPSLLLVILAEVFCSVLIIIGLITRLATIPLMIVMATAALIVHDADPFNKKELALMYLLGYVAIFLLGSGKFSVDYIITKAMEAKKKKRKSYKKSRPAKL